MTKFIEVTGKTEDDAITAGLRQLGLERDDVSVEILERAKPGFLGLGASPARIKLIYQGEDDVVVKARSFLEGLLARMGSDAVPQIQEAEEGLLTVNLTGEHLGALIGRRGETLDAIQHLTNYVVNHGSDKRVRVNVDAENYRAKREESLKKLAVKVAEKVLRYHRNVMLEPMNSFERHVIHATLQDYAGVTTYSTGTEPNRRVIVASDRGDNRRPYNSGR